MEHCPDAVVRRIVGIPAMMPTYIVDLKYKPRRRHAGDRTVLLFSEDDTVPFDASEVTEFTRLIHVFDKDRVNVSDLVSMALSGDVNLVSVGMPDADPGGMPAADPDAVLVICRGEPSEGMISDLRGMYPVVMHVPLTETAVKLDAELERLDPSLFASSVPFPRGYRCGMDVNCTLDSVISTAMPTIYMKWVDPFGQVAMASKTVSSPIAEVHYGDLDRRSLSKLTDFLIDALKRAVDANEDELLSAFAAASRGVSAPLELPGWASTVPGCIHRFHAYAGSIRLGPTPRGSESVFGWFRSRASCFGIPQPSPLV